MDSEKDNILDFTNWILDSTGTTKGGSVPQFGDFGKLHIERIQYEQALPLRSDNFLISLIL